MTLTSIIGTGARRSLRRLPVIGKIARQRDELRALVNQLWQPPGHFYSPIPSHSDLERHFARTGDALAGIVLNEPVQRELLAQISHLANGDEFSVTRSGSTRYYFDNLAFGPTDALIWSALLRLWRPKRVIEIGSGFSTGVLMDTATRYLADTLDVTLVEPYPDLVKSLLRPTDRVRILEIPVQEVPLAEFARLEKGDVLFIDSTHVCKTGSDVNYLLFEVVPRLAIGVYIHFHDVFYPFDYPHEWAVQGRSWNEAYLLRAFLQFNTSFEIVLWSSWLARIHPDALASAVQTAPTLRRFWDPASLWLKRVR